MSILHALSQDTENFVGACNQHLPGSPQMGAVQLILFYLQILAGVTLVQQVKDMLVIDLNVRGMDAF